MNTIRRMARRLTGNPQSNTLLKNPEKLVKKEHKEFTIKINIINANNEISFFIYEITTSIHKKF